jgi:hypothetical protein
MPIELPEISFSAGGVEHRLAPPTVGIAFAVSRRLGGLDTALRGVRNIDLDAICSVIEWALPDIGRRGRPELENFVFENLDALYLPVLRYALALQNGGKAPAVKDDAADGGASGEPGEPEGATASG